MISVIYLIEDTFDDYIKKEIKLQKRKSIER